MHIILLLFIGSAGENTRVSVFCRQPPFFSGIGKGTFGVISKGNVLLRSLFIEDGALVIPVSDDQYSTVDQITRPAAGTDRSAAHLLFGKWGEFWTIKRVTAL